MKQTSQENINISRRIEAIMNLVFENHEFDLNGWGHADNYCWTDDQTLILLECEKGQKHPNTNVLKVWPFLEQKNQLSITLLQYFFPENKAPKNRLSLCDFIGNKLQNQFGSRFQYLQLHEPIDDVLVDQIKSLKI